MACVGRVLVVDDEKVVADSLALVFAAEGYESRVAYSAEEAAENISEWQPAMVVVDVVLPGMNGIEFAIGLKTACPKCKVILYSGQPITASLVETATKDGHEFTVLPKPIHPSFLPDAAARVLAGEPFSAEDYRLPMRSKD